jgi:hypothetical protein
LHDCIGARQQIAGQEATRRTGSSRDEQGEERGDEETDEEAPSHGVEVERASGIGMSGEGR